MDGFQKALMSSFPGSMGEREFISMIALNLSLKGFTKGNCIPIVGCCRDEICITLMDEVKANFGDYFSIRGLGGFIFSGTSGFSAAHHHSPLVSGKSKYVYIVAPHIGISKDGIMGKCSREGRDAASSACGALCGFYDNFKAGKVTAQLSMDDLEMSAMSQILIESIPWGSKLDLAELTKIAAKAIAGKQLQKVIAATVDVAKADYAVVAGIQIHGPGLKNSFFCPLPEFCYSVVDGKKEAVEIQNPFKKNSCL
mmetsp:Transcript_508/g.674  ORF Transcript_508/g.674 Transcript_508/m.674 type:complete len:254 (+) Transcript_508:85-846(+)